MPLVNPPKGPVLSRLLRCADLQAIHLLLALGVLAFLTLTLGGCQAVGEAFLVNTVAGLSERSVRSPRHENSVQPVDTDKVIGATCLTFNVRRNDRS
jgi:hypothetical protein